MPGPGNYEEDAVKMTGKNFVSKFKSTISGMLAKSRRFHENKGNFFIRKKRLHLHGNITI